MIGTDDPTVECLRGSIIVSTPKLAGQALEECVVYIYDHSPQLGAQGVVVNRRSRLTVLELLERMDLSSDEPSLNSPLYHGGLVEENGIALLHTGEWYSTNTRPVSSEISISSDSVMIEKLMMGNHPANWLMCAGKCEWEPGALETEVAVGLWLTTPALEEMVFSSQDDDIQWRTAIEYCTKQAVDSWL